MSVESFDPGALALRLDERVLAELLAAAGRLEEEAFGLPAERVAALSGIARQDGKTDWRQAAAGLGTDDIVALIRLFTLGERLPGWEAGPRSPVIPLVAVLRERDAYPHDLTAWIKANTGNRFLPYGSLLDRL